MSQATAMRLLLLTSPCDVQLLISCMVFGLPHAASRCRDHQRYLPWSGYLHSTPCCYSCHLSSFCPSCQQSTAVVSTLRHPANLRTVTLFVDLLSSSVLSVLHNCNAGSACDAVGRTCNAPMFERFLLLVVSSLNFWSALSRPRDWPSLEVLSLQHSTGSLISSGLFSESSIPHNDGTYPKLLLSHSSCAVVYFFLLCFCQYVVEDLKSLRVK